MSTQLASQLEALFKEAGEAHHQAFLSTDGEDPEWPDWYAGYLHGRLAGLLDARLSRSELASLLKAADQELRRRDPGGDWPAFYARFFLDRYGPA